MGDAVEAAEELGRLELRLLAVAVAEPDHGPGVLQVDMDREAHLFGPVLHVAPRLLVRHAFRRVHCERVGPEHQPQVVVFGKRRSVLKS